MANTFAEALREAMSELGSVRTKPEIAQWIQQRYPGRWKPGTLDGHLYGCRVNHPLAFKHHRSQPKFLFDHGNGRFELYDASKHGTYENGLPAGEAANSMGEPTEGGNGDDASTAFAYEEHLRDYLAENLQILESGLTLWNGSELDSVEFSIEGRRIDIFAKDKQGIPVVVELKVARGHEKTIGQCLYYRAKIKELMKATRVRIIIVAKEISPELALAASEVPDVTLFEYALSMTVKRV